MMMMMIEPKTSHGYKTITKKIIHPFYMDDLKLYTKKMTTI